LALVAYAGEATQEYFTISNMTVVPGSDNVYSFTVSLNNVCRRYTAVNMDMHFPAGLVPDTKSNGSPKVVVDKTDESMITVEDDEATHSVSATYDVVGKGILRVVLMSTANEELKDTDGKLFTVYVKASPFMKPGEAHISVDEMALIIKEGGVAYEPENQPDFTFTVENESTVPVTVSSDNQWSTCVLPFDCAIPEGVEAYSSSETNSDSNGDYLVLTKATSIQAYTPYILYAPAGYTHQQIGEVNPAAYVEVAVAGVLRGAIVPQQITEGYVLQNQGDGVKFYNVNGDAFTIPEGRCWVVVPNQNSPAFALDRSTTDISVVQKSMMKSSDIYDLQGRRVTSPEPGHIYVMDGRKVLKLK
jgi:hypothetical protein